MKKQFAQEEKQELVARYQSGESVKALCTEAGVSKSSFYEWIKLYQVTVTPAGQRITPWGFEVLQRRVQKLEAMLSVLQVIGYCVSAPLQDKLREMEQLHGQFSVHVLCEVMNVPRGTFYNHDPVSYSKSQQAWDSKIVYNEARKNAATGGPFWIIG